MAIQIDVFGSYICRDVMRYVKPGSYTLNRCIGGVPISTLFEKQLVLNANTLEKCSVSQYDKRMMLIQVSRNAPVLLKKSNSSVLFIDLASECMKRIVFDDEEKTTIAYPGGMESDLPSIFGDMGVPYKTVSPLDLDLKQMEKKYKQFAQSIIQSPNNPDGYKEENIIVIEAYYADRYLKNRDATLHGYDPKHRIKEMNEMLHNLYLMLYKNMPNCQIIKLPPTLYSTENHIRGFGPLFYTEDIYRYVADCIEVLCGISKKNSLDNLYNEACLRNNLDTRVMRLRYYFGNIAAMKNEIEDLHEQVNSLKKEIALLKKNRG